MVFLFPFLLLLTSLILLVINPIFGGIVAAISVAWFAMIIVWKIMKFGIKGTFKLLFSKRQSSE